MDNVIALNPRFLIKSNLDIFAAAKRHLNLCEDQIGMEFLYGETEISQAFMDMLQIYADIFFNAFDGASEDSFTEYMAALSRAVGEKAQEAYEKGSHPGDGHGHR